MSTTPAGWYPDPEREGASRWWDGSQWAPSQDAAASDDRFKPKDDAATADGASEPATAGLDDTWSPSSGTEWSPQQAGSDQGGSAQQASAPAYGQDQASAWGQQDQAPTWEQQGQAPQYGTPQYGAPQYGATQTGTDGQAAWNQYGQQQPRKSRTGLFVGIGAGVLVLLLLIVGGGIWAVTSFIGSQTTQVETQGGTGTGGGGGSDSFEVTVAEDGQAFSEIEITTAGTYQIDVISTNSEDPRIELTGNGQTWSDDDGGDASLASRLTEYLDVGTYTLMVEEFSGDPLVAEVTVAQR